jgi:hypothetical protein
MAQPITLGMLEIGSNGGGLATVSARWAQKTNGVLVVLATVHRHGLGHKAKLFPGLASRPEKL